METNVNVIVEVLVEKDRVICFDFGDFAICIWYEIDEDAGMDLFSCYYGEEYSDFLGLPKHPDSRFVSTEIKMRVKEFVKLQELFQKKHLPYIRKNNPHNELWEMLRKYFPKQIRQYGR